MKQIIQDVAEFMDASGQPRRKKPTIAPVAEANLRLKLLASEITEYAKAAAEKDQVEIADAVLDILYVAVGAAHVYGFAGVLEDLWDEVHRTNMAKRFPDGKFHTNDDGKVIKPPGWQPPDLQAILDRASKPRIRPR